MFFEDPGRDSYCSMRESWTVSLSPDLGPTLRVSSSVCYALRDCAYLISNKFPSDAKVVGLGPHFENECPSFVIEAGSLSHLGCSLWEGRSGDIFPDSKAPLFFFFFCCYSPYPCWALKRMILLKKGTTMNLHNPPMREHIGNYKSGIQGPHLLDDQGFCAFC